MSSASEYGHGYRKGYADGEIGDSQPDITIEVTPGQQQVVPIGRGRWEIVIRNTGSVRLSSVELTEFTRVTGFPVGPGIPRLRISDCEQVAGRTALDPGEERRFACESVRLDDDVLAPAVFPDPLQITFRARGLPPGGGRFVTDRKQVTIQLIHPRIRIDLGPDDQVVRRGATASFMVTVTNTGDVDLTDVRVEGIQIQDCDRAIGTLKAGASTTYTCTAGPFNAEFLNQANVFATTPVGTTVADTDDLALVRVTGG